MDVVGSILKRMTAPPVMDEKERNIRKKQLEQQKKQREEEQRRMNEFREKVAERVSSFDADESQGPQLKFNPMDKIRRSVIHETAETAELVPLSFGEEEVDRHVIVFRQHTVPSEPELIAMRRNEQYVPPPPEEEEKEEERTTSSIPKSRKKVQPQYLQKYQKHLGGLEVAKDAAKTTVTQRSYGFVSSEQKKDKRTIEETLADIRARKRQRLEDESQSQQ